MTTDVKLIELVMTESGAEASQTQLTAAGGHPTMEFFEMCAALITQLAR